MIGLLKISRVASSIGGVWLPLIVSRTVNSPHSSVLDGPAPIKAPAQPVGSAGKPREPSLLCPEITETPCPSNGCLRVELMSSAGPLRAPGSPAPRCPINFKCYSYPRPPSLSISQPPPLLPSSPWCAQPNLAALRAHFEL